MPFPSLPKVFFFAIFCTLASTVMAQPGGGGGSGPGSGSPVPITGIEILVGLGGLYGAKKLLERKKNG